MKGERMRGKKVKQLRREFLKRGLPLKETRPSDKKVLKTIDGKLQEVEELVTVNYFRIFKKEFKGIRLSKT